MPTNLTAVLARNAEAQKARSSADELVLALWFVLCLINISLTLAHPALACAVAFAGQY